MTNQIDGMRPFDPNIGKGIKSSEESGSLQGRTVTQKANSGTTSQVAEKTLKELVDSIKNHPVEIPQNIQNILKKNLSDISDDERELLKNFRKDEALATMEGILSMPLFVKIEIIANLPIDQLMKWRAVAMGYKGPDKEKYKQLAELTGRNEVWLIVAKRVGFTPASTEKDTVRLQTLAFLLKKDLQHIPEGLVPKRIAPLLAKSELNEKEIGLLFNYKQFLEAHDNLTLWALLGSKLNIDVDMDDEDALFNKIGSFLTTTFDQVNDRKDAMALASGFKQWFSENIDELQKIEDLSFPKNQPIYFPSKEIGDLKNLKKLELRYNNVISLPKEIGNLTRLTTLNLNNNSLTELPDSIKNLVNLTAFRLAGNKFERLPDFDTLKNLERLNVSNNQLTSLPEKWSELPKLSYLFVVSNQLTDVPASYNKLASKEDFKVVNAHNNPINGPNLGNIENSMQTRMGAGPFQNERMSSSTDEVNAMSD